MRILSIKIGLAALCLILFIGLYVISIRSSEVPRWQSALNVVPEELLQKIIEENASYSLHLDKKEIRALKIHHPEQSVPLYLIDFRASSSSKAFSANPLCGASGCAFFGYTQQGSGYQRALAVYLDPHLPPNIPLFQSTNSLQNRLPVIIVNQLEDNHIRKLTLSFNEGYYEVIETQLLSQSYG